MGRRRAYTSSRDVVEMHFDVPRMLSNRFKQALVESEFSTQAEFFRFHIIRFVESKEKRQRCGTTKEDVVE